MSGLSTLPRYRLALCAAAAAGLALAAPTLPAHAQDYDHGYDTYQTGPNDDITVTARPHEERDPATGGYYDRVRTSRVVSYADLDLNSRWGVHELHARVVSAARDACDELENDPTLVTAPDDPPCVSTAVRRAMYQAPISDYFDDEN
jgi:UrcA family protein